MFQHRIASFRKVQSQSYQRLILFMHGCAEMGVYSSCWWAKFRWGLQTAVAPDVIFENIHNGNKVMLTFINFLSSGNYVQAFLCTFCSVMQYCASSRYDPDLTVCQKLSSSKAEDKTIQDVERAARTYWQFGFVTTFQKHQDDSILKQLINSKACVLFRHVQ